MEERVRIDVDKVNVVARELSGAERSRMDERRRNRHWIAASSAIASKIKRHLKVKGISQLELADMLGITPANVTRYLNGKTNFELKTLVEIERALGVHIIDRDVIPQDAVDKSINVKVTFNIPVDYNPCDVERGNETTFINLEGIKGKSKKLYAYG